MFISIQKQQGKLQTDDQTPTTYYTGFEVYNVNHYDVFRNPLEAKDLLLEALEVQRLDQGNLFDGEKDGRIKVVESRIFEDDNLKTTVILPKK